MSWNFDKYLLKVGTHEKSYRIYSYRFIQNQSVPGLIDPRVILKNIKWKSKTSDFSTLGIIGKLGIKFPRCFCSFIVVRRYFQISITWLNFDESHQALEPNQLSRHAPGIMFTFNIFIIYRWVCMKLRKKHFLVVWGMKCTTDVFQSENSLNTFSRQSSKNTIFGTLWFILKKFLMASIQEKSDDLWRFIFASLVLKYNDCHG